MYNKNIYYKKSNQTEIFYSLVKASKYIHREVSEIGVFLNNPLDLSCYYMGEVSIGYNSNKLLDYMNSIMLSDNLVVKFNTDSNLNTKCVEYRIFTKTEQEFTLLKLKYGL